MAVPVHELFPSQVVAHYSFVSPSTGQLDFGCIGRSSEEAIDRFFACNPHFDRVPGPVQEPGRKIVISYDYLWGDYGVCIGGRVAVKAKTFEKALFLARREVANRGGQIILSESLKYSAVAA